MSEFRPSSIHSHTLLASVLGSIEQEAVAMCVTNYLTASAARWDTEFSWESFARWVSNHTSRDVNELYQKMLTMSYAIRGLHGLIDGGYISRRSDDGGTYFRVTPALVDVMRPYAAA